VRLPCGQALGFRHGGEGLPEAAAEGVPRTLQGEASGLIQLARRRLARMALIGIGCCIDSRCLMVWFLFVGLQEPPPQIVARPLPNDILEWRKWHLPLTASANRFLAFEWFAPGLISAIALGFCLNRWSGRNMYGYVAGAILSSGRF
jgi:hypothetical protein